MRMIMLTTLALAATLGCSSGRHTEPTNATPAPGGTPVTTRKIPQGSGDWSKALADAEAYKQGTIDWAELEKRTLARNLKPYRNGSLGCEFLMTPVPAPPPPHQYDPMMMPPDWVGTWGEMAMTYWAGLLTREEYDKLHAKAHASLPAQH